MLFTSHLCADWMQELKELLGMACEADSHLLVVGISNSINLIDQCADDLSIKASSRQEQLSCMRAFE